MSPWERIEITTYSDGHCIALVTTNDNDDDGYDDGQVDEWTVRYRSLEEALKRASGGSHTGISGIAVMVYVDGVEYVDGKPKEVP